MESWAAVLSHQTGDQEAHTGLLALRHEAWPAPSHDTCKGAANLGGSNLSGWAQGDSLSLIRVRLRLHYPHYRQDAHLTAAAL